MKKNVLISGLLGGIVIFIWLIISNGILPFKHNIALKTFPGQKAVHETLKKEVTEPGIYVVPYLPPENRSEFPDYDNEPIYQITFRGETHSTVQGLFAFPVLMIFFAPVLAAWMLSVSSDRILQKYSSRVLFVSVLGLFLAVFSDILQISTGNLTTEYQVFSAVNNVITWILAGLVIAWKIKPETI